MAAKVAEYSRWITFVKFVQVLVLGALTEGVLFLSGNPPGFTEHGIVLGIAILRAAHNYLKNRD